LLGSALGDGFAFGVGFAGLTFEPMKLRGRIDPLF
jgi:hypothetical protein